MALALHGKNGVVFWNGTAVALVTQWQGDIGPTLDDITAMDSGGWRQKTYGIREASGAVTVRNAADDTNGQNVMRTESLSGTVAKVLRLYEDGTAGHYYSGSAMLNLSLSVAHDSPEEATFNFESHGAWAYT